ncbi:acyl-CoA thioesterase II [Glonium stellatum]|uniref:Acyl-CoA thioesterase II n=1 Tax=Glonium stellatum TaxID=574774 RepID=A0A8E2F2L3_9PEZI|nr:acyl-CoA thioesterase II [Glonium stellatum]
MTASLIEQLSLREISPRDFESNFNPRRMGNNLNIAYGGWTLAIATNAACQSAPPSYHLHSILGHYLGPTLTDRKLFCTIRKIRDTCTFVTRQVEVSQVQDDSSKRLVLVLLADFQVKEKASLLTYSAPPSKLYSNFENIPTMDSQLQSMIQAKAISQEVVEVHNLTFNMLAEHFNQKPCPEGIAAQNLRGMAKHVMTTQDHLPLTSKTSADWFKAKDALENKLQQITVLAFMMDASISFIPLTHNHQFLDDAVACSSLNFALRIFSCGVSLNNWHLREIITIAGAEGRTYTEGRLWDRDGRMVASMTQQSIMRPKHSTKSNI